MSLEEKKKTNTEKNTQSRILLLKTQEPAAERKRKRQNRLICYQSSGCLSFFEIDYPGTQQRTCLDRFHLCLTLLDAAAWMHISPLPSPPAGFCCIIFPISASADVEHPVRAPRRSHVQNPPPPCVEESGASSPSVCPGCWKGVREERLSSSS